MPVFLAIILICGAVGGIIKLPKSKPLFGKRGKCFIGQQEPMQDNGYVKWAAGPKELGFGVQQEGLPGWGEYCRAQDMVQGIYLTGLPRAKREGYGSRAVNLERCIGMEG